MAKVAVDIDSTLYDFDTLAREASLALYLETGDEDYKRGIYYSSEDWRAPAELLGFEKWVNGVIARCHDDEMILKQVPFPGAVETCQALMMAGHELIYISNRATETEEATSQWLSENGFFSYGPRTKGQSRLVVTQGDKMPFVRECQYIIDDRLKTVVEFVYDYDWHDSWSTAWEVNKRVGFMLKYPYNQNATDIPGVYVAPTWAGLNLYMVKKGLLPEPAYNAMELA